jgi:biotin carboxyl carrier protein
MGNKMEKVPYILQMVVNILVISMKMKFQVTASTTGQIKKSIRANGKTIK